MGIWGTSPGAGMDQSRANNLQEACPPHTRPTLQLSPSPPAITLSRGSRGRAGTGDHQPGPQPGVVSSSHSWAGRTFQGYQAVPNHSPIHHGDQPISEGAGHSSHMLRRLPSHCGSNHRAQTGPFICRGRVPRSPPLSPICPPFQDGIHTSLSPLLCADPST